MALAIAQHLKGYRYDLTVGSAPAGRDVVDHFLFDNQAGYCQHFAAAMMVLCRAAGIPARVVTGFGSGSYDASEEAYRVTQLNFHAWVEVGFDGFGWVTFDPTAGGVGGPDILDAAEVGNILDGTLPYYESVEKRSTVTYVTTTPEYVSGEQTFLIEGMVLEGTEDARGAPRVPMNVTLDVEGMDIFPVMVMPRDRLPILIMDTRTGSDGSFSALCALPTGVDTAASLVDIQVSCLGNELYESSNINVSIPIRRRPRIQLSLWRQPVMGLAVVLAGPGGGPMPGREVEIFVDGGSVGSHATNASGMVFVSIEADPGSHTAVARFYGDGAIGAASATLSFDIMSAPEEDVGGNGPTLALLAVVVVAVAAVLILATLRLVVFYRPPETIVQAYVRMLALLARVDIRRPENMTPFEFASLVEQKGARGYEQVKAITQRFVEETYAGREPEPGELSETRSALRALRTALGEEKPLSRRLRNWAGALLSGLLPRWMT
jgi:transglutaminase-like putative cysteine protease